MNSVSWRGLLLLALLATAALANAAAEVARPRVALILGGGGARGAAHIGVLEVLEKLRVPVDCVAGTSMGALVAGVYAGGMAPAEMRERAGEGRLGRPLPGYAPPFSRPQLPQQGEGQALPAGVGDRRRPQTACATRPASSPARRSSSSSTSSSATTVGLRQDRGPARCRCRSSPPTSFTASSVVFRNGIAVVGDARQHVGSRPDVAGRESTGRSWSMVASSTTYRSAKRVRALPGRRRRSPSMSVRRCSRPTKSAACSASPPR
jgi:hypothetical protein